MNHTPGPWKIGESNEDFHQIACNVPGKSIAFVERHKKIGEGYANALLISEAPKIFELLENATNFAKGLKYTTGIEQPWINDAEEIILRLEAIRKARGE